MKHIVKITKTFTHTRTVGALQVNEKELAPKKIISTEYEEDTKIIFHTKKDALNFVKFHGNDKTLYIGTEKR